MSERDFDLFMEKQSDRRKYLLPYEGFIKSRLEQYTDTSAAQMHDWLKEHFPVFPTVSPKTVFNFVAWVHQQYRIPKTSLSRQYEVVAELPYGKQAQADFGEYHLRDNQGKRIKVFFFTIVLSRSRFKYVWFLDQYFTIESTQKMIVQKALDYCCDNQVVSAGDFKAVVEQFTKNQFSYSPPCSKIVYMNPLNKLPVVALNDPATLFEQRP